MTTSAYSPGWKSAVVLGDGQELVRRRLLASIRHPSRTWHDAPVMRDYGRSPGTAHRLLHRLHALGVIAIQTTFGATGGTRFTFGVRAWHVGPVRRGMLARYALAPGQLAFMPPEETEPDEPEPPPVPPPAPRRVTPQASDTHISPPAGWHAPKGTFGELMRKYGFDRDAFDRTSEGPRSWRR